MSNGEANEQLSGRKESLSEEAKKNREGEVN